MSFRDDIVTLGVISVKTFNNLARVRLFLLIYFFFQLQFAFAKIENFKFIDVLSNNSISHTSVQCIVQDSLGFIWIGTIDGLNLFDGYEYRYFKYDPENKNSISNNDISCLAIQQNRYLWIGTRGGGANRMDLFTGEILRLSYELFDGMVRHIFIDSNNTVWIGTSSGLLKCVEDKEKETPQFKNISEKAVYRESTNQAFIPEKLDIAIDYIYQAEANKLLVGASVGVFEFNIDNEEFHRMSYHINYLNDITKIEEDKLGNLWISSSTGVSKVKRDDNGKVKACTNFNSEAPSTKNIKHDRIEAMVIDNEGRVWLGTHRSGLVLIENDSVIHVNDMIDPSLEKLGSIINELFIDNDRNLWIGQRNYPLKMIDLNASKFKSVLYVDKKGNALNDISIQSITGKGDKLWFGTSSGIDIYQYDNHKVVQIGSIPTIIGQERIWKDVVNSMLCDKDGNLWIGSSTNSLVEISPQGKINKKLINGYVFSIIEDNDNRIWFGTWGQGIGYVDKATGKLDQYNTNPKLKMGLTSDVVLSLCLDSRGYLWVGTKGGGLNVAPIKDVIDRKGHFISFAHQAGVNESISYNDVLDILETKNGEIWLATGRGLNKIQFPNDKTVEEAINDKLITFEKITEKDGLPSGMVQSLREDNTGNLWLGTNNGLCKFVPATKHITTYNVKDGLPSVNFCMNAAYFEPETENLFFGGLNGVAYFHPDSLDHNPSKSNPKLTEFRILNKTITPQAKVNERLLIEKSILYTENIRLNHNENELSFEFSALNYTYSNIVRYQYRLIGYNDKWIETDSKNRRITYTNLQPGSYVLEVKATNSDGSWSQNEISLNIKISPPFWKAWWAYGIYLMLLILSLVLYRRYSIIAVNEKNKLQLARLEQDKRDEIFEAKTRFFINVSHEIRTPLTLIHEPLNQLLSRNDLPPDAVDSANMIRRNLKRLLNQVNQLLEFRKIEKNMYTLKYSKFPIEDVAKGVITDFEAIIQHKEIIVKYSFPDHFMIEADKQLIETILYNLVSNSIKHLSNQGELKVELQTNENNPSVEKGVFKLLVADNGTGIPEKDIKHIFERFYQPQNKNNLNTGGTGIGLSIVKEYVEQHNGNIKVWNLSEGGCCFEITIPMKGEGKIVQKDNDIVLPLESKMEKEATEEEEKEIEKYLLNISNKSLSMVIIEDDLDLSIYLKETFIKQFSVTVFMDGLEASEKISGVSPDIIICDLMLPGMNGLDLTAKLKEDPETSHIPIIMLTAIHEEESMTRGLVNGADSYLTKPFNTNILKAQVVSILKSREKFKKQFSKSLVLETSDDVIVPREGKFMKKIFELVESRLEDSEFEVTDIVQEMGMSHSLLLRKFKNITGMSLVEYIRSVRIKKAVQLFKQEKYTVAEVAYKVGFSDPKYFGKCFYNEIGERPSEFAKKHHL